MMNFQDASEQKLRASEERFRLFLSASSEIVYRMSGNWREMLSLDGKSLLADTRSPTTTWLKDYVPAGDRAFVQATIAQAIGAKKTFELEHRVIRMDGTEGWLFSRAIPLLDEFGGIVEWFGVASDITERKRHEANLVLLAEVSQDLARLTGIDETLHALGEKICAHFHATWCAFAEVDAAQGNVTITHEWKPADIAGFKSHHLAAYETAEYLASGSTGKSYVVRNTATDPRPEAGQVAALGIGAFVGVPLVSDGRCRFVLNIYDSEPHDWRDDEIELMQELTTRIWTRLERARADEEIRRINQELQVRVQERTRELAELGASRQLLLRQMVTVQEEERRRISRELHDQLGQQFAALSLKFGTLNQDMEPAEFAKQRTALDQLMILAIDTMRTLAFELRPPALDFVGLPDTIQNYLEEWAHFDDIEVQFDTVGLDGVRLPTQLEIVLYRIMQETLTNIRKHAHATFVSVVLERRDKQLALIVEDNGVGFDTAELQEQKDARPKLGLLGIRERAALIGGTMAIESTPGTGTTLFVRIPLNGDSQ